MEPESWVQVRFPSEQAELAMLAERCGDALHRARSVLELLQSLEGQPETFSPGRVRDINVGAGAVVPVVFLEGVDPRRYLNEEIGEAGAAVNVLIDYFRLSESERTGLRFRIAQLKHWELEGLWVHGDESGQRVSEGPNAVRLAALIGFFKTIVECLGDLNRRVNRKLNPPQIRDRVKVDLEHFTVTVDGEKHQVTENQAIMIFHLAEANGEGLSSTEIGKRAKFPGEFKASVYRRQLKKTKLKNLIPNPNTSPGRKFRLVLPPLPE